MLAPEHARGVVTGLHGSAITLGAAVGTPLAGLLIDLASPAGGRARPSASSGSASRWSPGCSARTFTTRGAVRPQPLLNPARADS